jgi:hypothetical protein
VQHASDLERLITRSVAGRLVSLAALAAGFLVTLYVGRDLDSLALYEAHFRHDLASISWSYVERAVTVISIAELVVGLLTLGMTALMIATAVSRARRGVSVGWPDTLLSFCATLGAVVLSWSAWTVTSHLWSIYGHAFASPSIGILLVVPWLLLGAVLTTAGLGEQRDS